MTVLESELAGAVAKIERWREHFAILAAVHPERAPVHQALFGSVARMLETSIDLVAEAQTLLDLDLPEGV